MVVGNQVIVEAEARRGCQLPSCLPLTAHFWTASTASHRQSMFAAGERLWQCVKTRTQYHEAGAGRREQ